MSLVTNSSLQSWIDFADNDHNFESILNFQYSVKPCETPTATNASTLGSCQSVCTNSTKVEYGPVNFVNCGLWVELATLGQPNKPLSVNNSQTSAARRNVDRLLLDFAAVGLDSSNASLLLAVEGILSNVLLRWLPDNDFSLGGGYQCTSYALFGPLSGQALMTPSAISRCVSAICYTRKLHPEIGGIGVFIAMNIQMWLVIVGGLFILACQLRRLKAKKWFRVQCDRVLTGLNEFHQHQCYFFTTLLIAESLALSSKIENTLSSRDSQRPEAVPLLLSACLPIVVTHLLIAKFGRMTWYMLSLTLIALSSSIAVMSAALALGSLTFTESNNGFESVPRFISLLCGAEARSLNLSNSPWSFAGVLMTLIIQALCLLSVILSIVHKSIGRERLNRLRKGMFLRWHRLPFLLTACGVFVFAICFGCQIYIYNAIRRQNLIVTDWTLGQVISVGIWAPAIVEFLYIEGRGLAKASQIRYPPGWSLVRSLSRRRTDSNKTEVEGREVTWTEEK